MYCQKFARFFLNSIRLFDTQKYKRMLENDLEIKNSSAGVQF